MWKVQIGWTNKKIQQLKWRCKLMNVKHGYGACHIKKRERKVEKNIIEVWNLTHVSWPGGLYLVQCLQSMTRQICFPAKSIPQSPPQNTNFRQICFNFRRGGKHCKRSDECCKIPFVCKSFLRQNVDNTYPCGSLHYGPGSRNITSSSLIWKCSFLL